MVLTDPRTSTPRGNRGLPKSGIVPQVRRFHGVPRAVFEVCSTPAPVVIQSYPPLRGLIGARREI
jgi:hypothetical protein